jgi:signal transduction histidine kinase
VVLADDEVDRALERQGQRDAAELRARAGRAARSTRQPLPAPQAGLLPADVLAVLDREWTLYRALPTFPGELELAAAVVVVRQRFVDDLQRALLVAHDGDAHEALEVLEQELKPEADDLDDAVVKVVERNAQAANRLASRIDRLGRRSILRAASLDGLSVLLTVVAAFLVARFMRRYTRLMEQRADELELFAGRVAHDVLSPLGAASLALSYLTEKGGIQDPRARRMLALGQRGIERTRLIADDLLQFASAGARPDPAARADVRTVIAAVIDEARPMAEERRVTLAIETVDAGNVSCTLGILSSLVSNLVRNGVKYVGEGPGKTVCVRARRQGSFKAGSPAPFMRIEVEDNGPGLPAAMEAAVFEPYVRGPDNHQPGIGLGLATVKRVAEAHGGRVDVRSVPRAGCRFGLELPCTAGETAESAGGAAPAASDEKALPPPSSAPRVGPEDERRRDIPAEDSNPSSHAG